MDYVVLDREYRDYMAELKYPFSDNASMCSSSGVQIPPNTFLDLIIYTPIEVNMPIYLASINKHKDDDCAVLKFRDAFDTFVASCVVKVGDDSSMLYRDGIEAGSIVYDPLAIKPVIYASKRDTILFGVGMPVQTGRCFSYKKGMIAVVKCGMSSGSGDVHKEHVYIVAANGVHFEEETPGGPVSINLYGEEPLAKKPVKSINGIVHDHMWFAAHPNSGVKVETINNGVRYRSITDE